MISDTTKKSGKNGFTLIEVLIVIAIMTILISFLIPNFSGMRVRARDARRKSDLSQIQKSLELYKSDQDPPAYPVSGFNDPTLCNKCWSEGFTTGEDCTGNVWMRKFPCDPKNPAQPYNFNIDSLDELKYTLITCLENDQDQDRDDPPADECGGGQSYTIHEP